ncbi:MAG: hypothetical protein Q9173_003311 [Seirophora scorigena]
MTDKVRQILNRLYSIVVASNPSCCAGISVVPTQEILQTLDVLLDRLAATVRAGFAPRNQIQVLQFPLPTKHPKDPFRCSNRAPGVVGLHLHQVQDSAAPGSDAHRTVASMIPCLGFKRGEGGRGIDRIKIRVAVTSKMQRMPRFPQLCHAKGNPKIISLLLERALLNLNCRVTPSPLSMCTFVTNEAPPSAPLPLFFPMGGLDWREFKTRLSAPQLRPNLFFPVTTLSTAIIAFPPDPRFLRHEIIPSPRRRRQVFPSSPLGEEQVFLSKAPSTARATGSSPCGSICIHGIGLSICLRARRLPPPDHAAPVVVRYRGERRGEGIGLDALERSR